MFNFTYGWKFIKIEIIFVFINFTHPKRDHSLTNTITKNVVLTQFYQWPGSFTRIYPAMKTKNSIALMYRPNWQQ